MSKIKYRISKQAITDLNSIWVYTLHKWFKKQADRYYNLIIDEIEFISKNYLSGKSVDQTRKNYRVTKIKSHLIFYRKTDNETIEIVRILHQKMDVKKLLNT
ncbi:type II toxin-antitoxin system RelE/ParE family toxin [Lacinutrix sp. Bg11-31]|uniref:type II toxin-antitoxin system RelE/ParE family toxin n=1 Tax=Lacinutrix sp. Bg11-31 TaxID=2057808 RepID=UPI000C30FD6D|nr:type II toxin-antitoxin system RelE/ParE family toxin [Lacinutrix sp. Bg11-31]AUC83260.1 type II toxin-antitoxin system RelE/ParE family toxin [Lacinutrix sp. Bg11-31]